MVMQPSEDRTGTDGPTASRDGAETVEAMDVDTADAGVPHDAPEPGDDGTQAAQDAPGADQASASPGEAAEPAGTSQGRDPASTGRHTYAAEADAPTAAHGHGPASELVPLSEYLQSIIDAIVPLPPIQLSLLDAAGCALAGDVVAHADIPPFDNSAMDGYAVVADAAEGWLPVVGEIAAGDDDPAPVEPGTAVGIMTGAAMPPRADAVVPVEQVERDGARIRVGSVPRVGAHVRRVGESVREGETVLVAGTVLDPASVGMLAALGHPSVSVYPQPRVVVVSTGAELVEPGTGRSSGAIYDANSYLLTLLARDAGAHTRRRMIASDDKPTLREGIEELLPHADVLVTTGGVSAGRYDLVKVVLNELGDVRFNKIGMRPGMPQAFGFIEADPGRFIPCFGLPGNPVSAYVSFEVFVRPTIRRLQGRRDLSRPRISATLEAPLDSVRDKVEFTRVSLRLRDGEWQARPTGAQGSGILRSLVDADGLAEVPADRDRLEIGERIVVHLLRSV